MHKANHFLFIGLLFCLVIVLSGIQMQSTSAMAIINVSESGEEAKLDGTGVIILGAILTLVILYFGLFNRRK